MPGVGQLGGGGGLDDTLGVLLFGGAEQGLEQGVTEARFITGAAADLAPTGQALAQRGPVVGDRDGFGGVVLDRVTTQQAVVLDVDIEGQGDPGCAVGGGIVSRVG